MLKNLFPFLERNVLQFHNNVQKKENALLNHCDKATTSSFATKLIRKGERKIYDAPNFKNDYYLHLIDAIDENLIGVILGASAHVLNKELNEVVNIKQSWSNVDVEPTSIAFVRQSKSVISIGTSIGLLQFWDWKVEKMIQSIDLHADRIGSIQWNPCKDNVFATGSKDNKVIIGDTNDPRFRMVGKHHFGEICGLSWNQNGWMLASGGNDNLVNVWDIRNFKEPVVSLQEHRAAVRALAWCPWKNSLLASGGGSGDMRMLVTNTDTNELTQEIHTSSQVCALAWDDEIKAILTAHGFSKYQLSLWKYDTSELVYEFLGHKNRILSMIKVPASGNIITASADETIRVWNMKQFLKPFVRDCSLLSPILLR
jgi:cell division cycle protein 20 (cofactor of APC complex)